MSTKKLILLLALPFAAVEYQPIVPNLEKIDYTIQKVVQKVVQEIVQEIKFPHKQPDKKFLAEQKCLATMIYGEARGEPRNGKIAVAYSAVNRAVKKSVCDVVLAPMQYSIFNNNPALRAAAKSPYIEPRQKNTIDNESWARSVDVAQMVLAGKVADPTDGATHYIADQVMRAKGYKYPRWSRQYTQVAEIGGHRFFKPYYPARNKLKK
jgi:spore germination cell wall hydrolase CwlJ-like protein